MVEPCYFLRPVKNKFIWLQEENFRKRKLPVVSSVVKVKKFNHDGEEEEEEDDCGSRTGSISSSVSVPAKPERRYLIMSL